MSTPVPVDLVLHQKSRELELIYADGERLRLPFELMRIYSPSAEVQGHSPEQAVLQTGKREVGIVGIAPVGQYALQPTFSDGHDSGLFTWALLRDLALNASAYWARYERALAAAGRSRDEPMASGGSQPSTGCG
jgi:DUF971 family protein